MNECMYPFAADSLWLLCDVVNGSWLETDGSREVWALRSRRTWVLSALVYIRPRCPTLPPGECI